jgi:two-component system, OmpR family, phosphate regulon response regulator PhoB
MSLSRKSSGPGLVPPAAQPAAPSASPLRPLIVVIDDDVAVDESFGHMLQAAGYDTHTEADCRSGLAYLESAAPSVVILDLHLPDGTGLECLRRVRSWPTHGGLPVAILTGDYFLDDEIARELNALGARVFFKPVWEDDLLRIVRELMAQREPPAAPPQSGTTP